MHAIITLLSLIIFLLIAYGLLFVYAMCKIASMGDATQPMSKAESEMWEQDRRELEEMQDEVER
jgi:hypothetical protein